MSAPVADTASRTESAARKGRIGRSFYDRDLAASGLKQAALIRTDRLDEIDRENVAEEIESLGRQQFSKVRSAFGVILLHTLKRDHQPEGRSQGWVLSIHNGCLTVSDVVGDSPSLRARRPKGVAAASRWSRLQAAEETGLKPAAFDDKCPHSLDDILRRPFEWPEA